MGRRRGKNYIDPVELLNEIKKFKENMDKDEIMSDKLGEMLIKLAMRYASSPNFSGYSYKEDFISDAIFRMVQQIHKIDVNHPKCNPFSYLTKTCYHVFISKINKEKKFNETKENLKDHYFDEFDREEHLHTKKKN